MEYFNSTIVRLKDGVKKYADLAYVFQFYNSAIKSGTGSYTQAQGGISILQ